MTGDLRRDLIAGYEAGQTTYRLGRHGLNRNTIAAHLRSAGVTIRMDGMTPQQIEQAVEYYPLVPANCGRMSWIFRPG